MLYIVLLDLFSLASGSFSLFVFWVLPYKMLSVSLFIKVKFSRFLLLAFNKLDWMSYCLSFTHTPLIVYVGICSLCEYLHMCLLGEAGRRERVVVKFLLFSLSGVPNSLWPMYCSMPGFPDLHHLLGCVQTHFPWVGDVIQPSHPLSSISPPATNLSQHQRLFQWVASSHQVANYWSFSFSISPSNEYSGLFSLRTDWFDLFGEIGRRESIVVK